MKIEFDYWYDKEEDLYKSSLILNGTKGSFYSYPKYLKVEDFLNGFKSQIRTVNEEINK